MTAFEIMPEGNKSSSFKRMQILEAPTKNKKKVYFFPGSFFLLCPRLGLTLTSLAYRQVVVVPSIRPLPFGGKRRITMTRVAWMSARGGLWLNCSHRGVKCVLCLVRRRLRVPVPWHCFDFGPKWYTRQIICPKQHWSFTWYCEGINVCWYEEL